MGEVILASTGCMELPSPSACPPLTRVRTGWHANRSCACAEETHGAVGAHSVAPHSSNPQLRRNGNWSISLNCNGHYLPARPELPFRMGAFDFREGAQGLLLQHETFYEPTTRGFAEAGIQLGLDS